MADLTIGQLTGEAHVNVETVRYYERRGLVAQPARPRSGYRRYPAATVARLRFIKRAQELGFTLQEIDELLELRVGSDTRCEEVREHAQVKVDDIDAKIRSLQRMRRTLKKLVTACRQNSRTDECPILESLEK